MPYNGSGTYAAPSSSFNPAVADTVIDETDWNDLLTDLEDALSAVIHKGGQTTTTGSITFAAGIRVNNTGLKIYDTNASHFLSIVPGSNITADRVFTLTTGDAARTLDMSAGNLTAGGGQYVFPASQNASADANTLDDYEEGTFTPGVAFGGGTTGITYSTQAGAYTKIGNTVLVWGTVTLSAKGSSTGAATLTGLPFTAANASYVFRGALTYVGINLDTAGGYYSPSMSLLNSTSATLQEQGDNVSPASLTDADFTNTSGIGFFFAYHV